MAYARNCHKALQAKETIVHKTTCYIRTHIVEK